MFTDTFGLTGVSPSRAIGLIGEDSPALGKGDGARLRDVMGGVAALVAVPVSVATLSSCPTPVLPSRNTTALQGLDPLKGCADQSVLAKARVEERGFPGAGHGGLLRSRGELGASKSGRILLGTPTGSQGEIAAVWEREAGAAGRGTPKQ